MERSITKADEIFSQPLGVFLKAKAEANYIKPFCIGEEVRDWSVMDGNYVIFPYNSDIETIPTETIPNIERFMWSYRTELYDRKVFGGKTYREAGKHWYEYGQIPVERYKIPLSIAFAFVASHNHFVLDRGGKVFKQSAPVIKLKPTATEDDHLALLGLLNSSTACFWMKQVSQQKQMTAHDSVRIESIAKVPHEFAGTQLQKLPLPNNWNNHPLRLRLIALAKEADTLAQKLANLSALNAIEQGLSTQTKSIAEINYPKKIPTI